MKYQVITPLAEIYGTPDLKALRGKYETQLVYGEIFIVEGEAQNGWYQGTCAHDGYQGYIEARHLSPSVQVSTHVVNAARSHTYREETIKSPMVETLSFGSRIKVTATQKNFAQINNGAWIYYKHITPIDSYDKDYIATAKKFLETPYYWGGRSGFGTDCSGMVQVCLSRAGLAPLRDTEMQEKVLGMPADDARVGDIVYFPGHVGMMVDDQNLIHASAFHMKVAIEPLRDVAERSKADSGKGITSVRRL